MSLCKSGENHARLRGFGAHVAAPFNGVTHMAIGPVVERSLSASQLNTSLLTPSQEIANLVDEEHGVLAPVVSAFTRQTRVEKLLKIIAQVKNTELTKVFHDLGP